MYTQWMEWASEAMRGGSRKKEVEAGTAEDYIVLGDEEVGDEGVGRAAEQGGDGHPTRGPSIPLLSAASTPEVQQAIQHAVDITAGKALPANTTIIAPNPALHSPPPQLPPPLQGPGPHRALTPAVRQVVRQTFEAARGAAGAPRHSSHSSRSVYPPPTTKAQPQPPVWSTPHTQVAGTGGCSGSTEPPLPKQRLLSEVPVDQRGTQWILRNKPYVPWTPSLDQIQEARQLLSGELEWATPKASFVPRTDPKQGNAKASMRWECGHASCTKLLSTQFDARGHYQSSHLDGHTTSHLCSCQLNFNSCTTLANHLDLHHNAHHGAVSRDDPRVYLSYLDQPAAPVLTSPLGPPAPKCKCRK